MRELFSLVVDGSEAGLLTRIFISTGRLQPFEVQLHTHRYPITITTIRGDITHHKAIKSDAGEVSISEYDYKSFLNGGGGLKYVGETRISCSEYKVPQGSTIFLSEKEYHTISCDQYAMWIVQEEGFKTQESSVLGIPFVLDGLYSEPAMFQINDKRQIVLRELKKIVEAYKLV